MFCAARRSLLTRHPSKGGPIIPLNRIASFTPKVHDPVANNKQQREGPATPTGEPCQLFSSEGVTPS
jgi:hypothetical protein